MHHLFEKHLKPDYVLGFERFWKCAPLLNPIGPCAHLAKSSGS